MVGSFGDHREVWQGGVCTDRGQGVMKACFSDDDSDLDVTKRAQGLQQLAHL